MQNHCIKLEFLQKGENMKRKKNIICISVLIFIMILLYFIGWYFLGGKKITINLNSEIKNEIITKYEINGIDINDVISFEHVIYLQKKVNILKINKNEINKKILNSNPHIEKTEKLNIFGFPYPNSKLIPYGIKECCCFYDDNYYYLSVYYGGTNYNNTINDLFWEIYNTSQ